MENLERYIIPRDTARYQNFLHKLKNGENASIVFLGGSITFGFGITEESRFDMLFRSTLQTQYPEATIRVHNLSLPGVPSIFGLYQTVQYVKKYEPDLVFIEFAINDMKNFEHQSAFEGMVRFCLELPNAPAVALLLAKSDVGYTCENYMDMVADHYSIPSVLIGQAVDALPSWDLYSSDYGHPHEGGHQYIAQLMNTLTELSQKTPPLSLPLPEEAFCDFVLKDLTFLNRTWTCSETEHPEDFTFEGTFSRLFLLFFKSPEDIFGTAEICIDGTVFDTLTAYHINGWERAFSQILDIGEEPAFHKVTIRMQKGEQNKCFALLNIGYC